MPSTVMVPHDKEHVVFARCSHVIQVIGCPPALVHHAIRDECQEVGPMDYKDMRMRVRDTWNRLVHPRRTK